MLKQTDTALCLINTMEDHFILKEIELSFVYCTDAIVCRQILETPSMRSDNQS